MPRKLRIKNTVASLLLATAGYVSAKYSAKYLGPDNKVEELCEEVIRIQTGANDKELTWIQERSYIWDKDDLVDVNGSNPSLKD